MPEAQAHDLDHGWVTRAQVQRSLSDGHNQTGLGHAHAPASDTIASALSRTLVSCHSGQLGVPTLGCAPATEFGECLLVPRNHGAD